MEEGKTKKSILNVAKRLFERFGYDKTSMNDIARHSHKAKGSLYYNFSGKANIFKALISEEFETIKKGLAESSNIPQAPSKDNSQIAAYLRQRMELFNNAPMIKLSLEDHFHEMKNEILTIADEVRQTFDQWEWQFFYDACILGKKYHVLTPDIQPNAFADMLQMLLKSLEIQFFAKNKYEESKSTYESMITFLLNDYKTNNNLIPCEP